MSRFSGHLAGLALVSTLAAAAPAMAAVTVTTSQSDFLAAGTIASTTDFSSFNSGSFDTPGSPYSVGNLTFIQGGQNLIIETGSGYAPSENLFTDNFVQGTTMNIAGAYDLVGLKAGNFLGAGDATFDVLTNLGSYSFTETVGAASGPLSFFGFQADSGEYITSIHWSGGSATGITDIQLGSASVPEPATLALLGAGLAGMTLIRRRASHQA